MALSMCRLNFPIAGNSWLSWYKETKEITRRLRERKNRKVFYPLKLLTILLGPGSLFFSWFICSRGKDLTKERRSSGTHVRRSHITTFQILPKARENDRSDTVRSTLKASSALSCRARAVNKIFELHKKNDQKDDKGKGYIQKEEKGSYQGRTLLKSLLGGIYLFNKRFLEMRVRGWNI